MQKILFIAALFLSHTAFAQPQVAATYTGGHGCVSHDLTLYTDSSFIFITRTAIAFPIKEKSKGYYNLDTNSITLYTRRNFYFLIPSKKLRYREDTFRIENEKILLYSVKSEQSKDEDFILTYNTLYRVRS
jgi:hypothetical protein